MKLFATLRKIRELERTQLPFLKSLIDLDIIVEVGYAEEEKQPLTLKQLFLLNIGSLTTVRRRLAHLVEQGIVARRRNDRDQRSAFLVISKPSVRVLTKYGSALTTICTSN